MVKFTPRHYELEFVPDLVAFTFTGKEKIVFGVDTATIVVSLHAADLIVSDAFVFHKNQKISAKIKIDRKKEELSLTLPEAVSGELELHLVFSGTLNDKLIGFYRSEYKDASGAVRYLATTQFEAADARRAFPCWDEPAAKAAFDVTLFVEPSLVALSNMPSIEEVLVGQKKRVRFARTPVMSTYLLYLGVGDFEFISAKQGNTLVRVAAMRGKKDQCRLSLELTQKFLDYFEKYFGIPYPLPKLDMIAIPDFASGAMENWGAITFRETLLLFDVLTSSADTKQRIAEVIAHELAHQWFGNLVTMKWWNDLWLNESFATFMATKAVDQFYPEWELWDQFLKTSMNEAMSLDALQSSHPIEVDVKSPAEVREIFDDISYDKGGSVLRMLETFVGDENFRKGLSSYLLKHMYSNATTNDLWDAVGLVAQKPVRKVMNTWVRQMGYPIVDVTVDHGYFVIRQRRFLLENGASGGGRWLIPVRAATNKGSVPLLLEQEKADLLPVVDSDWVKLNEGQKGFYRVSYEKSMLQKLQKMIQEKMFSHVDRWGVQNDVFALCVAGNLPIWDYLDFVAFYAADDNYLASSDVAENLYALFILFSGETFVSDIVNYNLRYFRQLFARLGWDKKPGEKHTSALLRGFVISALGKQGDETIIAEAQRRFDVFIAGGKLDPDLRGTVYSLTAFGGDALRYKQLKELYLNATSAEEKIRFLVSLSNFKDEKLLLKTLAFSLSSDVKNQNYYIPVAVTANNPFGRKLVWPWVKKNWKKIVRKGGAGNPLLQRVVGCLSTVTDPLLEKEIAAFFDAHKVSGTERKVAQTLERIRIHASLVERGRKEFRE